MSTQNTEGQQPADEPAEDNAINPLDLIVALFLCADSFLQQELALKMSMCQFSVTLLLPHANNNQSTLMLWALRDIVKEWRPHDLSESRGFVENNIIQADIPFFSFVRLKNCSLSKSQCLNHVLSHVSTATFVFLDKVEEEEHKILTSLQHVKSKLFFIVNRKEGNVTEDMMSVEKTQKELDLPKTSVKIKDDRVNVAGFSDKLCAAIKKSLTDVTTTMTIENMLERAVELGLSVDERTSDDGKKAAQEIVEGIRVQHIPDYKKEQLPLQGVNWKRLSQLEMKECRLQEPGDLEMEEYKSQLHVEKQQIKKELGKHKLSHAMKSFIDHLSTTDKDKRDFFLKWIKLQLNAHLQTAIQLPLLRHKLTEQSNKEEKNMKEIAELDQDLLDSSLGLEHYMREMGLIYEVSLQSRDTADEISHLPGLAAEMLLDGYPLELLDGDASNIPERWVTDVLTELHKKVGEKSKLLVLTVLGVQSSGKSTLLNTMFGVQFPVSSGRCTRGAYMLFLRVSEDMQCQLNCDFIVLIDTEGLKSPHLAQLEDSYEHDNQLATFVIGLSDVTIINVSMENSTEMKDVLQIATHAFLRMKEIGKKPVCHFVHQNVGGVSAHAKTKADRKLFLDQLNEMTQIAAEMEKQTAIKAFTDVLDYDMEKNNWNIPGLWHGTPPMAPVNTGYSEAVADLKKNLLETGKGDKSDEASQIPEFLEWMRSLWKAVKYENFIFSFRNTIAAQAYDNVCKEFNQWEWEFRKEILSWQTAAEWDISYGDNKSDLSHLNELVQSKKFQVAEKIADRDKRMKQKLQEYYKRKDSHVNLIEKFKTEFFNSISSLAKEIQRSVNNKLDCALELRKSLKEVQDIQRKNRGMIEEQVMNLLSDCKHQTLTDKELEDEFEKMWAEVTVNVSSMEEQNIPAKIFKQLKRQFLNHNVNEELDNIGDLKDIVKDPFKVKKKHLKTNLMKYKDTKRELQSFADSVIESCTRFVHDTAKTERDYNDSFTRELLEKVDESLKQWSKHCKPQFEFDLKLYMCGIASREFLHMHRKFLSDRDPKLQLEKYKPQYLSDFLDLYKQRDDCQRKAKDFVRCCIKPAVEDYISRSLGIDIVDEILTSCHSAEYSSRSFFQYNIQKELLQKEDFESFVKYIHTYDIYVKDWIFQHILQKMSEDKTLCKLKNNNLQVIVTKITEATERASKGEDGVQLPDNQESITKLINNMRKYLIKDISISEEAEKSTLFQIQSTCHPFTESLSKSLGELKEQLQEEFSNSEDITETLNKLPIKPQDELFKRMFGCGKQCPFCKVPCEAGGKEHEKHHAAVHRPQGLGGYRFVATEKLVETLCTTSVHSKDRFKNTDTKWKYHPFKKYTTYYPDWLIPPDSTFEASDYWKYVLVQYNERFAQEYKAKPADVPEAWRRITKEQALKGLKDAFNIK
ncbi:interferon-induced very large GTPase 1-like [Sander lucioperca]|uniref:interferon-induced very large GTPase 1-like n=1 Tax=Sander lucioperca TaxID=283035 RepID=UPI00125E3D69|nr:interferon-induced very large GTPase 1-like [Sander lucioperca]